MDNLDINHGNAPRWKGTEVGTILQLQTCPYNESHRVGHGSFAAHLNKCRNALSEEERQRFVICEYNATHHMYKEVYDDHLKICTDFRYYNADQFYLPPEFFGHPPARTLMNEKALKERDEDRLKNVERLKKDKEREKFLSSKENNTGKTFIEEKAAENAKLESEFIGNDLEVDLDIDDSDDSDRE